MRKKSPMKPYAKQNRSLIACSACRSSKVRCTRTSSSSSCKRCSHLALPCHFEMKLSQRSGAINQRIVKSMQQPMARPALVARDARVNWPVLPPKSHLAEVIEIFFGNQYRGIFPFIHKPSFVDFLLSDAFNPDSYIAEYHSNIKSESYVSNMSHPDPVLLLSILALCSRLHYQTSLAYAGFLEDISPETFQPDVSAWHRPTRHRPTIDLESASNASKYFGWHARQLMKDVFDSPTVQRIQAFTLLSSHEWGEGNNSRSFLYIGIAARMALVLGLGNETNEQDDTITDNNIRQIVIESKRRSIWSVYMMDRCNSSGRQRSPAIRIEDIKINLPSLENDFIFGNANQSLTYTQFKDHLGSTENDSKLEVPLVGFSIMTFEIWAKIAKWVGEVGAKYETDSPWLPESKFHELSLSLDRVEELLPLNFKLTQFNLKMHIQLGTATHFGYFHGLFLTCRIFLNREYLFCNPRSFPDGWWKDLILQLLGSLEQISSMMETLRARKMLVIAPFTGFESFTCVVTSFYFSAFPNEILLENIPIEEYGIEGTLDEIETWKFKYKKLALTCLELLSSWSLAWELGRKWQKLAVKLGVLFGQLAQSGSSEFNSDYLRHSMHDYGSSEVLEVYSPGSMTKMYDKSEREIIRLLNKENSSEGQNQLQSNENGPSSAIQLLAIPAFSFSTKYSSIYPGWNESDFNELIMDANGQT